MPNPTSVPAAEPAVVLTVPEVQVVQVMIEAIAGATAPQKSASSPPNTDTFLIRPIAISFPSFC
jgi:hypothetical protein